MSPEATVRAYYRAIDDGEYDDLAALLAPGFVHDRPDRTLSGRASFVRFMREERPRTDTEHAVDAVYRRSRDDADGAGEDASDGDASDADASDADAAEVAVRGRLLDAADGTALFGFVDVFRVGESAGTDGRTGVVRLTTYTD
ncbi:nuclear transport factor 2 family protein [Halobaculum lipolyticum]|uniref:Nuclear transport factor 2 family protein n=1 Tax=Halobaculum lipolyticum TaxID=3032001 RepID=A0ABD5WHZ9_9EURY|nr:nuclear transport factor 2 family protein [Halobaculum sp. DT31]